MLRAPPADKKLCAECLDYSGSSTIIKRDYSFEARRIQASAGADEASSTKKIGQQAPQMSLYIC